MKLLSPIISDTEELWLFVGGPYDGQRIAVDGELTFVYLSEPFERGVKPYEEYVAARKREAKLHTYRAESLVFSKNGEKHAYRIYVHENIKFHEALQRLCDRYPEPEEKT